MTRQAVPFPHEGPAGARVLFIAADTMVEAIAATGVLGRQVSGDPYCRVTVVCGAEAAPIFAPLANVERVHVRPPGRLSRAALRLALRLAGSRWNLLIDTTRRGAPPFQRAAEIRHIRPGRDETPPPRLWLHFDDRALATRYLGDGAPVLAIAPGGADPDTVWSPERFGQLVTRLTAEDGPLAGYRIAAFGTKEERARARMLFELLPKGRTVDLMGKLTPLQAAACIERAAGFIGPNMALGHLAAAVATPSLLLRRPHDPLPLPEGAHVAEIAPAGGEKLDIGRSPLDALTIEQVYRSFLELLDRQARTAAG